MRTVAVLAMLLGAACILPGRLKEDQEGTGGAPGTGGELSGAGGTVVGTGGAAPVCDDSCQADLLWSQYVAAIATWQADTDTVNKLYREAYNRSLEPCLCNGCDGQFCSTMAAASANADAGVVAARGVALDDLDKAEAIYVLYSRHSTAAGQEPMPRLTSSP